VEKDRGHSVELQISYSDRTFVGSFKVDPQLWSEFKQECKIRGVSICHVLEALIEAWIQGQRATSTVLKPVTVNLTMQHVVQKPRRILKIDDVVVEARAALWPPQCPEANEFWKGSKEVGCLKLREFVKLEACWRCYLQKANSPEASQL